MAGEKYADRAIAELAAWLTAQLPAQLRQVETDQGLTPSSLTDPVAVVKARVPSDNRSPLIEVFEESWDYIDFRQRLLSVDCSIVCSFTHDADISAGELFVRRYLTALLRTLEQDATFGGKVEACIPRDGSSAMIQGAQSETREVFAQGVEIRLHQP